MTYNYIANLKHQHNLKYLMNEQSQLSTNLRKKLRTCMLVRVHHCISISPSTWTLYIVMIWHAYNVLLMAIWTILCTQFLQNRVQCTCLVLACKLRLYCVQQPSGFEDIPNRSSEYLRHFVVRRGLCLPFVLCIEVDDTSLLGNRTKIKWHTGQYNKGETLDHS